MLQEAKRASLNKPHMEPLTAFAQQIRQERPPEEYIPDFDSQDGGVNAEVLFVLEAPGPKAASTGFVSQDNPDKTAANLKTYLEEVGINRKQSLVWNIVPLYLGDGTTIRAAASADIQAGSVYLERLLVLLPRLKAMVLLGRKAQSAFKRGGLTTALPLYEAYHPSPRFINLRPDNKEKIVEKLRQVALQLNVEQK